MAVITASEPRPPEDWNVGDELAASTADPAAAATRFSLK